MSITARQIQRAVFYRLRGRYELLVPNFYVGDYEADLYGVSLAGYATEWEIKLTAADFRADAKKTARGQSKHDFVARGLGPARFVFVMPAPLAEQVHEEVPPWAGILPVFADGRWAGYPCKRHALARPGARLNNNKVSDQRKADILISTYHRFWRHACKT